MVEVPPLLISGSGCPVTGAKPTATAILKSACVTNRNAMPIARNAGNEFSHRLAIFPARIRITMYKKATKTAPMMPISSMIIA